MIRNGIFLSFGVLIGAGMMGMHEGSQEKTAEQKIHTVNVSLKKTLTDLVKEKEKSMQLEAVISKNRQEVESARIEFEEIETEKNAEIDFIESEKSQQKEKWNAMTARYKRNVLLLKKEVENLKSRLQDADILYAERYRLSQLLSDLNSRILKSSHKIDLSKKACAEFKEGNSWNKVSKDDCITYETRMQKNNAMIDEFDEMSTKLDKINRQLFALGIIKKT